METEENEVIEKKTEENEVKETEAIETKTEIEKEAIETAEVIEIEKGEIETIVETETTEEEEVEVAEVTEREKNVESRGVMATDTVRRKAQMIREKANGMKNPKRRDGTKHLLVALPQPPHDGTKLHRVNLTKPPRGGTKLHRAKQTKLPLDGIKLLREVPKHLLDGIKPQPARLLANVRDGMLLPPDLLTVGLNKHLLVLLDDGMKHPWAILWTHPSVQARGGTRPP